MNSYYYYLHTNGDLIAKNPSVVDSDACYFDSPFVKKVWKINLTDRKDAWKLVLEALALGCRIDRANELAHKWNLTFEDSIEMLSHVPTEEITDLMRTGLDKFVISILKMDIENYWTKVKEKW
jgi:hypothetical protein